MRQLSDRLWNKVNKTDTCWLWTGHTQRNGYGQISRGYRLGAAWVHRVSYELANGPIPKGLLVCHACDVPLCVNPAHLFLGTYADNARDAMQKKRLAWGERNRHAKFSTADIIEMRALASNATPKADIRRRFGISQSYLNSVLRRDHWRNLPAA